MPHPLVLRILRTRAPAAVRLIALATVTLGRAPVHHTEAGISRASWYRHRVAAQQLVSQTEKNQARAASRRETPRSKMPRAVDKSAKNSTALAHRKASSNRELRRHNPRIRGLSTPQKRINQRPEIPGSTDAPFSRAHESHGGARATIERFRQAWLRVNQRNRDVGYLVLSRDALGELCRRLEREGPARVEAVALHALHQAERGEIPSVWWSRIFLGQGYAARAISFDAHVKRTSEIAQRAARPPTHVELELLEGYRKAGVL